MSKEYTFSEEFKQLCDDLAQGIALLNDIPCENAVSSLLAPFPVRRTVTLFFEDCASILLTPQVVEGIERIVEEGICDDDSARSFVALCEEISHVLLYASRLDVGRTTSHVELETQANIDVYFMLSSFLMQQNNQDHKWNGLHEYVVDQVFRDQYVSEYYYEAKVVSLQALHRLLQEPSRHYAIRLFYRQPFAIKRDYAKGRRAL